MSYNQNTVRVDRLTADERGIRQAAKLFFFGKPFDMTCEQITKWAYTLMRIKDQKTKSEKVVARIIELHCQEEVRTLSLTAGAEAMQPLIKLMRTHLPGKEVQSILETIRPGPGV